MPAFSSAFSIAGRTIGAGAPCYVIAEAGVAHFGSLDKACRLVDLAAGAGADAVKFQIFDVDQMISAGDPQWRERMRSRQLPYADFVRLREHCRRAGITFFATAHDEPSLRFMERELDVPCHKIGSGEVGNWPYIRTIAALGKPVILSTGMYTLEQVRQALATVAEAGNPDVAVLHCVTRYPTPPEEVNLRAMDALRELGAVTGYSDHTAGFHIPLAAVARGAAVIEKHITLDYDVPNAQDWKVSCGPGDLATFIAQARAIEAALGSGTKAPSAAEAESLVWAGKSLTAARDLATGEVLTSAMLVGKRPGTGIPAGEIETVLGRRLATDVPADTPLRPEHLA